MRSVAPISTSLRATATGFTAILMWSTLALLTTHTGRVPPFQLTTLAFSIAFVIGLVHWARQDGQLSTLLNLPGRVWLLGVGGLFGYHFFYFMALRNAPAVEASLIAYLWPLLIVGGAVLASGIVFSCSPTEASPTWIKRSRD